MVGKAKLILLMPEIVRVRNEANAINQNERLETVLTLINSLGLWRQTIIDPRKRWLDARQRALRTFSSLSISSQELSNSS